MNNKAAITRTELEQRERKYGNSLVVSGIAVIFFGFWSVLKIIEEIAIGKVDFFEMLDLADEEDMGIRVFMTVFFVLLTLAVIFLHYRVGRAAILVGRGKKKKFFYLLFAISFLLLTVVSFPTYINPEVVDQDDVTIAAFFVDVAYCLALFAMVVSYSLISRARKQLREG